jgi:hypothetical protein
VKEPNTAALAEALYNAMYGEQPHLRQAVMPELRELAEKLAAQGVLAISTLDGSDARDVVMAALDEELPRQYTIRGDRVMEMLHRLARSRRERRDEG